MFLFAFYCMNAAHKQSSMEVHRYVTPSQPKVLTILDGIVLFESDGGFQGSRRRRAIW